MRLPGIANPEQLKTLRIALDEYALGSEIHPGTQAYEDAARYIMALFNKGAFDAPDELATSRAVRSPSVQWTLAPR